MKSRALALLEVVLVFAFIQIIVLTLRRTGPVQWEFENLGWSYLAMVPFVGIPALIIWLGRREWADFGISLANWPTNLDIGIKAFLVRAIPLVLGSGLAGLLSLPRDVPRRGAILGLFEILAIVVILWLIRSQKPVGSGRRNVITVGLLLLIPLIIAVAVGQFGVVIISTVFWQFVFSGFGEELVYRGYFQSRLNQAFGRPWHFLGVQFGAGLILASLLFGLLHAFNTYDAAIGLGSLSWGWAISSSMAGLFFGVLREKTGTLLAPAIAHGLPDALGEPFIQMFGWF